MVTPNVSPRSPRFHRQGLGHLTLTSLVPDDLLPGAPRHVQVDLLEAKMGNHMRNRAWGSTRMWRDICLSIYLSIYLSTYICVCVGIYIYIYICIYTIF